MDIDRLDDHDRMAEHEKALRNGRSDDLEYNARATADVCNVLKKMLTHCSVQCGTARKSIWPKTPVELLSFLSLVVGVCWTVIQMTK